MNTYNRPINTFRYKGVIKRCPITLRLAQAVNVRDRLGRYGRDIRIHETDPAGHFEEGSFLYGVVKGAAHGDQAVIFEHGDMSVFIAEGLNHSLGQLG